MQSPLSSSLIFAVAGGFLCSICQAQIVQLRVTAENLAAANSIAFAPLRVGFNNGTFDSFNNGQTATAPIISIAEGGSGSDWFPAFQASQPTATLGTVAPNPAGPLLPGASASSVFTIDTSINRFFTFGSMVVPSNDHFIGNDSPTRYMLFDATGQLNIASIPQNGGEILGRRIRSHRRRQRSVFDGGHERSPHAAKWRRQFRLQRAERIQWTHDRCRIYIQ